MTPNKKPSVTGLTQQELLESRGRFGLNVDTTQDFTTLKILMSPLFSVFNIVMMVLVATLILIGQKSTAQFIGFVALINTAIELIQEIRARLIVKKLSKLSEKTTKVVREGKTSEV